MGSHAAPRLGRRRALLLGAGGALVVLAVSQVALPRLAAHVVRERLGGPEQVRAVSVRAVPALQLLWGRADRVDADVRAFDAADRDLADELAKARAVDALDVRIEQLTVVRGLRLADARLTKRDDELEAAATLDPAALRKALPAGVDVRPVAAPDGAVVLEGRAGLLGLRAAMRLRVVPVDGRVVVRPELGLLALLATATVFDDERIAVTALTATPLDDGRFRYTARASLP